MTRVQGLFVAGTDTGVGKTLVAAALARALAARELRVEVMKPVAAGAMSTAEGLRSEDALALMAAAGSVAPYERVNPYCLELAASPHIAASNQGVTIDRSVIRARFAELCAGSQFTLVEGAGGWLAPVGMRETMADIAADLALPVLLVVGLRLGCLSHALLTHEAVARRGLRLAGWVANQIDPEMGWLEANVQTLAERLGAPPLMRLPAGVTASELQHAAESASFQIVSQAADL